MSELSRRKMLSLLGAAPIAGGAVSALAAAPPFPKAPVSPSRMQALARERAHERYFPDVVLTTHEGRKVRFYDDLIKGKVVTINFFFASCDDICPRVTSNIVKVQKLLGDQVGKKIFMYSFSLKPEQDTVEVIRKYREAHGVRPGWTFLTGKPADLELLRRKLGFTNPDPKLDQDINQHIGNIRYGNEPDMLWGACPGMASPQWIAESIEWMVNPNAIRVGSSAAAHDH